MQPTSPLDAYNDPALINARNEANTAFQQYGTATTNAQTMPDLLKKALDQKFASQQNPLYGMQETASKDYFDSLDTGYKDVLPENNNGMIFSPEAQAYQISGKRNSLLASLSSTNQMIAGGFGGIENVIKEATNTYRAMATAAQFKSEGARQKYMDLLDLIDRKVEQANKDRDFEENVRQFGLEYALRKTENAKGTASDQNRARYNEMLKDIKGKMTLRSVLAKYGSDFTPDEMYQVYNTASPWGPAKEGGDILQKLGIASGETADQKNRKASLAPAKVSIKSLNPTDFKLAGPQNQVAKFQIDNLGGLGVDGRIVSLNQNFELMKQSVVRALQGARMSDKDIEIAKGYIPSIIDTPGTIQIKLKNLDSFIDALGGDTSSFYDGTSGGGTWE